MPPAVLPKAAMPDTGSTPRERPGRPGRPASRAIGSFRYTAADDSWEWSDAVYAMHGVRRGEVVPTTALLLSYAHSADRRDTARLIETCLSEGGLFSRLYRVVDETAKMRWVLIAAEGTRDGAGAVTGIRGYLVDLTGQEARAQPQEAASTLRKTAASRATIEQAKGALMLAYGLDADAAFALMCWQSQHANIKLRDLADRLVTAVGGDGHIPAGIRQSLDEIVYSLPEAAQAAPVPESGTGSATGVLGVLQDVQVDGAVVLRISGEIDMATGPRLDSSLAAAVAAAAAPAPVVVDLTGVRHLGSVGVALLTSYHRRCHLGGTPLRVVAGSGPPAGVLSVTHTGLDVYQSLPDALAAPVSEPSGPPSLRPERHHGD